MAWGQEKGADFHISALRACQYEIFDFVPCSLPLKTLILLTFSCFLIRRRGKECPFLLVENEQREKRCAVRPSKSSARKRGGCISCGRFGAAKKDSGRHGANEVGGVPIAFLRRESAAFSAFHAENIRKCNRHGGGAAAGVARRLLPSLRPISSRISSLTSPDLAQIACKSGESVGGLKEARFCEKR